MTAFYEHRRLFLVVLILSVFAFVPFIFRIEVDKDKSSWFKKDDPILTSHATYRRLSGNTEPLIFAHEK